MTYLPRDSGFIQLEVLDMDAINWLVILSNTYGSNRGKSMDRLEKN